MITSQRLVLRPPEARDRPALYRMFGDPLVMAELGSVKDETATEAALAKHDADRWEGLGFQVVERRDDQAVVGFCGLKRGDAHNPIAGEVEAGWIIDRPYWRNGYALEAMRAAIGWGWANTGAPRIVAIASAVNRKSRQLMHRLGMKQLMEGDFEHRLMPPGDPLRSMVTFAIERPGA